MNPVQGSAQGGAVYSLGYNLVSGQAASLTISNSILSNSSGGKDLIADSGGAATSVLIFQDQNIVMSRLLQNSATSSGPAPLTSDPQLAALALNAPGLTQTMAISSGSPAFNAGVCQQFITTVDQLGTPRPQGAACDIGAYELIQTVPVTINSSPTGLAFSVSGFGCQAGSYTGSTTLQWEGGESCTVTFTTPQPASGGFQNVFSSWADNNSANPRVFVAPTVASTYTADFQITTTTTPASATTVYNPAAQTVTLTATVTSASPVNTGNVTFTVPGIGTAISGTVSNGAASATLNIPAGQIASTYSISAVYNGTNSLASSTGTQTLSITAAPQTITFIPIPAQTVGSPLTLSAIASSGLAVSFASTTPLVCMVANTTATFLIAGSCTIQATQAGNSNYAAASVSQSFTVNPETQTITFGPIPTQIVGSPLALSATATSGLAVSFASTTPTVCMVANTTATFLIAGSCTIQATQAGNNSYAAAASVSQSFTVNPEMQTIAFGPIPTQIVGSPLALSATATSGLAVSFASTTPTVCMVANTTANFLIAGTCTIQATQAGNGSYAAAASVSQSFTVNPEMQTITFSPIPTQIVGSTLALSATATSGMAVSFASTTPTVCMVANTTATFLIAGSCTIQATQAGNNSYAAAASVSQSFTVNPKPQTITFGTIPAQVQGKPLTLTATASSGLAVVFTSSTPGICAVSGTAATLLQAGACTIVASQPGNAVYQAATPVSQSFTIQAAFTLTPLPPSETVVPGLIAGFAIEIRSTTGFTGPITMSCSGGPAGAKCIDFPATVQLFNGYGLVLSGVLFAENTPPGTYTITFTGTSGAISDSTTATFTVIKLY